MSPLLSVSTRISFRARIRNFSSMGEEWNWSLGFGSNMDAKALVTKKQLNVKDHTPAVLKGWRMAWMGGIPWTEPAYANVWPSKGDEVHGVAFCMDKASEEKLDKQEASYSKEYVDLVAYDGRKLKGFVYYNKNPAHLERYLDGLRKAGLPG